MLLRTSPGRSRYSSAEEDLLLPEKEDLLPEEEEDLLLEDEEPLHPEETRSPFPGNKKKFLDDFPKTEIFFLFQKKKLFLLQDIFLLEFQLYWKITLDIFSQSGMPFALRGFQTDQYR